MTDTSPPRPNLAPPRPGHTAPTSPPRPLPIGRGEGARLETTPTSPLGIDWDERLRQAVEQTVRRRQARRDLRARLDRARAYGLQQRHAAKLNRRPGGPRP